MGKKIAVVALSGGIDSCVTLAIAAEDYDVATLHVSYGQRTEEKELLCFNEISDHYDVKWRLVTSLPFISEIKGSSLLDTKRSVEKGKPDPKRIPSTYVPFRNGAILTVASAWAEVIGSEHVFIGAVQDDSSGYPDCRKDFFQSFEKAVNLGTKPNFNMKIHTPVIQLSKGDIIKRGLKLKAPFHLTWSCYTNMEVACGECESCYLRLKGFKQAGADDPIKYRKTT